MHPKQQAPIVLADLVDEDKVLTPTVLALKLATDADCPVANLN
jgi:hypothetical protein